MHADGPNWSGEQVAQVVNFFNKILWGFVGIVSNVVLFGWVLSVLWSWFVVEQLHVAPLSIRNAYGISILVDMLLAGISTRLPEKTDAVYKEHPFLVAIIQGILIPLFFLALGFIVHLF